MKTPTILHRIPTYLNGATKELTLCVAIFLTLNSVLAQGDLLVTPRRVVFEGNDQRQEITLANTGQDTARYIISFIHYRMTDEGVFEQIDKPDSGQFFAEPYLRYFPRQVTLAPQESQVIRMQLRKQPGMKDGEYRSHMYFRAVPVEKPLGEEELMDTTMIGVRLIPIFGISIPVIIRVGKLEARVQITDIELKQDEEGAYSVSLVFLRQGTKSSYGDLVAEYVSPTGSITRVGNVRGIAVYTPNTTRKFTLPLQNTDLINLKEGKLKLRYQSSSDTKPEIYAEQELLLKK